MVTILLDSVVAVRVGSRVGCFDDYRRDWGDLTILESVDLRDGMDFGRHPSDLAVVGVHRLGSHHRAGGIDRSCYYLAIDESWEDCCHLDDWDSDRHEYTVHHRDSFVLGEQNYCAD